MAEPITFKSGTVTVQISDRAESGKRIVDVVISDGAASHFFSEEGDEELTEAGARRIVQRAHDQRRAGNQ